MDRTALRRPCGRPRWRLTTPSAASRGHPAASHSSTSSSVPCRRCSTFMPEHPRRGGGYRVMPTRCETDAAVLLSVPIDFVQRVELASESASCRLVAGHRQVFRMNGDHPAADKLVPPGTGPGRQLRPRVCECRGRLLCPGLTRLPTLRRLPVRTRHRNCCGWNQPSNERRSRWFCVRAPLQYIKALNSRGAENCRKLGLLPLISAPITGKFSCTVGFLQGLFDATFRQKTARRACARAAISLRLREDQRSR